MRKPMNREHALGDLARLSRRALCALAIGAAIALPAVAQPAANPRLVQIDAAKASAPVDRFFDLSVGADYPGTTIRDANQAQLKIAA